MGIKGLMKLINTNTPGAIKEKEMKSFFNRKIALDASMSLYQFLIAIRIGEGQTALTNDAGEVTSHLIGMFYRTLRMMDAGIKPAYVFDGKPPELKSGELDERRKKREENAKHLAEAKEEGNQDDINKFTRRGVHVNKQHNEEAKKLLRLMGVPVIEAPSEAEAQCAALTKAGKVYATATEDMDALTFGTNILLRNLTASKARKLPVLQIDLKIILEDLNLTMDQFIDVCILSGCDYTNSIRGIGPMKALAFIKKYKTIEKVIANIDTKKYKVPDDFLYKESAKLFVEPEVTNPDDITLTWKVPDEEGLIQFMVKDKGFAEDRIRKGIERIHNSRGKSSQKRMESFFGMPTIKRKKPTPAKKGKKKKKRR